MIEHQGTTEDASANLTIRRLADGNYAWTMAVPVAGPELADYHEAIDLAKKIDERLADAFAKKRGARRSGGR